MKTSYWHLDNSAEDEKSIAEAAALLRRGELVAFPTETVYGLGADGMNGKAARKIFIAKGRPTDNPLILHIAQMETLYALSPQLPPLAQQLAAAFWPGPLTLVVPAAAAVPREVTAGLTTVAVRMPDSGVARRLIELTGSPLAAPSANSSGRPSPTDAASVAEDMQGKIAGILDGGSTQIGLESTIIDTTVEPPAILRPGAVTREMLEKACGCQFMQVTGAADTGEAPKAPGMKYRHYAPKAPLELFPGNNGDLRLKERLQALSAAGQKVAVMSAFPLPGIAEQAVSVHTWQGKAEILAENLYAWLREFDRLGVDIILAETVENRGIGSAVMNRLKKAAGVS